MVLVNALILIINYWKLSVFQNPNKNKASRKALLFN